MKKTFLKISIFLIFSLHHTISYSYENEPSTLEELLAQDELLINSKIKDGKLEKKVVVIEKSSPSHYSIHGDSFFDDPIYKTHDAYVDVKTFTKKTKESISKKVDSINNTVNGIKEKYIVDNKLNTSIIRDDFLNIINKTKDKAIDVYKSFNIEKRDNELNKNANDVIVNPVPVIPVYEK